MAKTPARTRLRRAWNTTKKGASAVASYVPTIPAQAMSGVVSRRAWKLRIGYQMNQDKGWRKYIPLRIETRGKTADDLPLQISKNDMAALQSKVGSLEAFNQYVAKREDASLFSDIKVGDKTLGESDAIDFSGIRSLSDATQQAQNTFNEKSTAINKLLLDPDSNLHPGAFVAYLHELKQEAIQDIKKQHAHELSELERKFTDDREDIKTSLGIDDAGVDQLKADMKQALEDKQKEELTAFEKEMNTPINELHKELQREGDRISFLTNLARVDRSDMAEEIRRVQLIKEEEEILAARAAHTGAGKATLVTASSDKSLKNIKPLDLEFMRSLTGRKIKINKEAGTFEMSLPHQWWDPQYYKGRMNELQTDLRMLAQAIKASGHDSITMNINQPQNEEFARKLAREAYLACRMEGFDHEKISLNVNGTKYSGKELIEKLGVDKEGADKLAAPKAEERERALTGPGVVSAKEMQHLKEQVDKIRGEERAKTESPGTEPAEPDSTPSHSL